jgi:hypothetical protein
VIDTPGTSTDASHKPSAVINNRTKNPFIVGSPFAFAAV